VALGTQVWISGAKGTVLKSVDDGKTWRSVAPRGTADLDFRDIVAIDDQNLYLLSSGQGELSRIYNTTDGGATWRLLTTNLSPQGFFDCMAFWDPMHGIVIGDPVMGRFTILTTENGGVSWWPQKGPQAQKDETAFAASGSCIFTRGVREAWFGTGGTSGARVFHSTDAGQTWDVAKTPMRHDSANAGIFSIAFSDGRHGFVVGGDYTKPTETSGVSARTEDGGKTWTAGSALPGFRSSVSYHSRDLWVATGTSGSDYSTDGGKTWKVMGSDGYNAVSGNWAVGPNGAVARLKLE